MLFAISAFSQTGKIVGKWVTIDDATGAKKSVISIYKTSSGDYEGKIEKLIEKPNEKCTECTGADKNKPIAGMVILKKMKDKGGKLSGGTILDPGNGKTYSCSIEYDSKSGKLKVRGSLDKFGVLGRTQTWLKAN